MAVKKETVRAGWHEATGVLLLFACVVGLLSDGRRTLEQAVLAEMVDQGAQLLTMDEHDADVAFLSGLPAPLRDVLYLPIGQLVALERSLAKGLNPDAPENLVAYVTLNEEL